MSKKAPPIIQQLEVPSHHTEPGIIANTIPIPEEFRPDYERGLNSQNDRPTVPDKTNATPFAQPKKLDTGLTTGEIDRLRDLIRTGSFDRKPIVNNKAGGFDKDSPLANDPEYPIRKPDKDDKGLFD